jgi:DNA-binding response OmpR family regulator
MPGSILVVDDDADIRTTLRDFLSAEGFTVHVAREGQHALHVLERIPTPDLILLDFMMPIMNGTQFLTELRRTARGSAIPVVILSAWARGWSGARLEVADVLSKPVDLEFLLSTVQLLCGAGKPRVSAPQGHQSP